jgi:hypothetical protein
MLKKTFPLCGALKNHLASDFVRWIRQGDFNDTRLKAS